MSRTLPVLVVGAGPVGLTLALSLLKNGVSVRIIERLSTFHGGARGTAIQPRSQEVFTFLGIMEDVQGVSTPPLLQARHGPDGSVTRSVWSESADDSPGIPYRNVASVSQAELEGILRKHIRKLGGVIETGIELTGLEQDEKKVVAQLRHADDGKEEHVECCYLVGADGAKGRTRHFVGINFVGETKEADRLLSGNVAVTGADSESWSFWGTFATSCIGLKPLKPEPLYQVQALGPQLPAVLPTDVDGVRELFYSISGRRDIQIHSAEWMSQWRANIRMADTFNVGRVFIAGDAAHCHSPIGGQGTNSGVLDAINLAWKIAYVYHSLASPTLLTSYSAERMPVIAEMLNITTAMHSRTFLSSAPKSSALEPGLSTDADSDAYEGAVILRPKHLMQLGVNYRWSPIVLEGRTMKEDEKATEKNPYGQDSTRLRAGDRAPDAPGLVEVGRAGTGPVNVFRLFDITRHLVLVFHQGDEKNLRAAVRGLERYAAPSPPLAMVAVILQQGSGSVPQLGTARVFVDSENHAHTQYQLQNSADETVFVVIRPDGFIGSFAPSVEGVHTYFMRVLGECAFFPCFKVFAC